MWFANISGMIDFFSLVVPLFTGRKTFLDSVCSGIARIDTFSGNHRRYILRTIACKTFREKFLKVSCLQIWISIYLYLFILTFVTAYRYDFFSYHYLFRWHRDFQLLYDHIKVDVSIFKLRIYKLIHLIDLRI